VGKAFSGAIAYCDYREYMDNKKHRQYRLHCLLKSRRYPVTIAELCKILEASDKTIYRDIQEFRDLYRAPICSNEQGYYYEQASAGSFELPGTWFSDAELQALLAAQQLLSQIQPGLLDEQITPLKQFIINMLTHYRDNWYLDAWCHAKKALRTFSLDNIQKTAELT